ncbi:glycosyltransferase family 2 protein [Pricia sp.]|uniref:glycosyltransferase n=1 Tax=Pricia sp. TaxID=2268138 RepID=UPI00359409AF
MGKIASDRDSIGYFDRSDSLHLDRIADDMAQGIQFNVIRPKVVITIPAHNEAIVIGKCIESLARQRTVLGDIDKDDFEVLILCHNCTDATKKIGLQTLNRFPDLNLIVLETNRPEVNNVGAVRRVLMRIARARIFDKPGYIAMTDADTVAHPFWVANILGYIGSGYGLICGRIDINVKSVSPYAKKILALKSRYSGLCILLNDSISPDTFDPLPRHGDNSGPNMAVRADTYDYIGGMAPIGFCEDIDFYDRVVWGGYEVRHCPMAIVTTSGRCEPRAPWGFGAELGTWNGKDGNEPQVEGLEALLERSRIYALIRKYLANDDKYVLWAAARQSGIDRKRLVGHIQEYGTYRSLLHRLEKDLDVLESWGLRYPKIGIRRACDELEDYLSLSS